MLTCRQSSESEPTVSFRYFKASPPGATRIYCDKHMKRAPNGWHQCAGCVFKGRVPFHPAQDFDEAAESYKKQCTSRKRCKVCVAEKTEEELEQARKRMKHVQKKEDDAWWAKKYMYILRRQRHFRRRQSEDMEWQICRVELQTRMGEPEHAYFLAVRKQTRRRHI